MSSVRFQMVLRCYPSPMRWNGAVRPIHGRAHPLESHTLLYAYLRPGLETAPFSNKRESVPNLFPRIS